MHLESLTIKNFRLLEDIEVKKLGHVNLIVGKNNSGKSTVLEALALLAGGFQKSSVMKVASNRDDVKRVRVGNVSSEMRIAFENFFSGRTYPSSDETVLYVGNEDLYVNVRHIIYEEIENIEQVDDSISVKREQRILDKSKLNDKDSENTHIGLQVKTPIGKPRIINLEEDDSLSFRRIQLSEQTLPFSYIESYVSSIEDLAREFDTLVFTEGEEMVVKALQIIEPNTKSLAFLSDEYEHSRYSNRRNRHDEVRVPYINTSGTGGKIPLHSMGDGIIRLLQIFIKLFDARNGFLLIDEFENGLHYNVQPEVWRLIFELAKQYNIQVFATTHSWDCIESFAQVAKEREDLEGVLFRMGRSARKSDKGKVIATVYDEDELYYITKAKMEVR